MGSKRLYAELLKLVTHPCQSCSRCAMTMVPFRLRKAKDRSWQHVSKSFMHFVSPTIACTVKVSLHGGQNTAGCNLRVMQVSCARLMQPSAGLRLCGHIPDGQCVLACTSVVLQPRKDCCRSMGGFKAMPLLEDVDLVCRLRKVGPPALVRKPITTSARRWQRLGLLQTTLINQVRSGPFALMVSIPGNRPICPRILSPEDCCCALAHVITDWKILDRCCLAMPLSKWQNVSL